jgi:sporulation protein YlmC with PRC-barrel domain
VKGPEADRVRGERLTVRVSNLYDKEVFSSSGNHLGRIENVMIEAREGRVSAILLKGKTGIPYERVTAVGDVVIVQASNE